MNNNQNSLVEIDNVEVNSNDLRTDLDIFEKHKSNEFSMINQSLNKYIDLQEKTLSKINQIKNNNELIRYNLVENDFQKTQFYRNVHFLQRNSINDLYFRGIFIWKNESGSIYYRLHYYGDRIKCNNDEDILKLFNVYIKIYEKSEDVIFDNIPILVKNLIPIVKDEVFYPINNNEFFNIGNIQYRNEYKPTLYEPILISVPNNMLIQNNQIEIKPRRDSTVETFIKNLVENDDSFEILMKILINFKKTKNKSNYAFVLIGDDNSTDILINEIIKPLFASKNEYFSTIDDESLEKKSDTKIIENKIFYHVKNLSEDKLKSKRVSKLIFDIVRPNKTYFDEAILNNESYVWGELFITSCKNNPYLALEDVYSKCIVIKVKNLKTILKKMNQDKISLIENIQSDLHNFSYVLSELNLFDINQDVYNLQQTEEYRNMPYMTNGIIYTKKLKQNIVKFVRAIQNKNIHFFEQVSIENRLMYDELLHNFEEGMVAQPLVSEYFNIVYEDIIFEENNYLLDILKQDYEMFKITPNDKSKYNGKKRYKIC